MARPRKNATGARDRIETTFWEMLAEKPLSEITVGTLSKRAGVNHNTFYYHFRSLEDLGCRAIDRLAADAPIEIALDTFLNHGITARELLEKTPSALPTAARASLVAHSGSTALVAHLRTAVRNRWLTVLGVAPGASNPELEFLLTFLIGGMLTTLGEYGAKGLEEQLPSMLDSGLGSTLVQILTRLGKSTG